jgi:hypothetical protein
MNAASQILRVLAIIGALAAGTFFFLTRGKIEDLNSQLTSANSALATTKQSDAADIAAAKARAETAETAAAKVATDLQDAQKSVTDEKDLVDQANTAMIGIQKQLHDANNNLAEKQNQVDDLKKQTASEDSLQSDNDSLKAQVADIQKQLDDYKKNGGGSNPGTAATSNTGPGPASPIPTNFAPTGPVVSTTIGAVDTSTGLVDIEADLQKDSAIMLEAGGTELGRGTVVDSQAGHSIINIISTGQMSVGDFFKIVTEGRKVDYVLLK